MPRVMSGLESFLLLLQELGQLWERCSKDCGWQAVFCALGLQDEIPTSVKEVYLRSVAVLNASKGKGKPPADAPATPKATPKKKKKDEMTPDKPASARRRVQRVDSCRPAPFGKPMEVDQTLKGVQKKGKGSKKASEKPDEEEKKDVDPLEIDDEAPPEEHVFPNGSKLIKLLKITIYQNE